MWRQGREEVEPSGFEPKMTEPKSAVLPLHHGSVPLPDDKCSNKKLKMKHKITESCPVYRFALRTRIVFLQTAYLAEKYEKISVFLIFGLR